MPLRALPSLPPTLLLLTRSRRSDSDRTRAAPPVDTCGGLEMPEGNGMAQAGHSLRGLQITAVSQLVETPRLKADDGAAQLPVRTCEPGSPSAVKAFCDASKTFEERAKLLVGELSLDEIVSSW